MKDLNNISNEELLDRLSSLHHKAKEVSDISHMVKSKMKESPIYIDSIKEKKRTLMPQLTRYAVAAVVALFAIASTFLLVDNDDGLSDYKETITLSRNNDIKIYDETKAKQGKQNYFRSDDLLVYQF